MAPGAPVSLKNSLSTAGGRIEAVWIGRRLQRVNEERKGVELFVTVTLNRGSVRRWKFIHLRATQRDETIEAREKGDSLVQRRVTHQGRNGAVKLQSCVIQILPILYADQIRHLNRIERTRAMPRNDTRGDYFVNRGQILDRHFLQAGQRVRTLRESGVKTSFKTYNCADRTSQSRAQILGKNPIRRNIARGALEQRPIRHQTR